MAEEKLKKAPAPKKAPLYVVKMPRKLRALEIKNMVHSTPDPKMKESVVKARRRLTPDELGSLLSFVDDHKNVWVSNRFMAENKPKVGDFLVMGGNKRIIAASEFKETYVKK